MTFIFEQSLICIFTINRPLFAFKNNNVYRGLLYDTYICSEYSVPQIKMKGTKFSCIDVTISRIIKITDTSKNIENFTCNQSLEQFYEDDIYKYFYNCEKGSYIIVEYENGYKEEVKDALKNGIISINDLDNYNIDYMKYKK